MERMALTLLNTVMFLELFPAVSDATQLLMSVIVNIGDIQRQSVNIRNPHAIRPWQHVLEPLSGYLMLAQKLLEEGATFGEGWNFGPNDEDAKPVSWIVDRLTNTWGDGAS